MISACIVNLNEAEKLEKCLKSLEGFADEIIVIDLGSTDNSTRIAKKFDAQVYKYELVPYVELVRNFAISKTKGDWILILDPDETIGEKLKEKLRAITKTDYVAVNIPRKNIFFGKWISHTNWWPDYHIRFFKRGKVKWSERIHSYPQVIGKIFQLSKDSELAIIHMGYDNFTQFIDRQNRYSDIEAQQKFDKGIRFSYGNFIWNPTREFLVRFIKHQGYLDGFYGFSLTILMCIYKLMVEVKLWQLSKERE